MQKVYVTFLYLIIITVSLVADPGVYLPYHTPKNYVFISLIAIALLAFVISLFRTKDVRRLSFSIIEILLTIRLIWLVIVNPKYLFHGDDLGFLILLSLTIFVFLIKQFTYGNDKCNVRRFISGFLLIIFILGIVQSLIGIYQFIVYRGLIGQNLKTAMIGLIGSANGYGSFLAVSFIAGLNFIWNEEKKGRRILFSVVLGIILIALIFNQSRGAALGLLGSVAALYLFYRVFIKKEKLTASKSIIYAAITLGVVLISSAGLLYIIDTESSFGRIMVWRISLPMLTEHPVAGVGQGNYAVEYLNYQAKFFQDSSNADLAYKAASLKQAHNEFLQAFCESGLIGGIIFIAIWVLALTSLFRKIISDFQNRKIYFALTAILLIVLIHSQVDTPLHVLPLSVIAYSVLGLGPVKEYRINRTASYILLGLSTIYLAFVIRKTVTGYSAYRDWYNGTVNVRERRVETAIKNYKEALIRLPDKGELLFHLGSAYIVSGSYSKGIYYAEKSKEYFNERNIYLSLSYAYLKLKNYPEAEKNAKIALGMFPDHLMPYFLLGQIYYEVGRVEEAKEALKKCINRETRIQSDDVEQISEDAKSLWKKLFEN